MIYLLASAGSTTGPINDTGMVTRPCRCSRPRANSCPSALEDAGDRALSGAEPQKNVVVWGGAALGTAADCSSPICPGENPYGALPLGH